MRRWIASGLLGLFVASQCSADMVYAPIDSTNGLAQMIVSDPVPVGAGPAGENLLNFIISVSPVDTTQIATSFSGTLTGTLHQQALFGSSSATLDEPIANTPIQTDIDTHFLAFVGDLLTVGKLDENIDAAPVSTEPPNAVGPAAAGASAGFGTYLSGIFVMPSQSADPFPIAQIIVPAESLFSFNFAAGWTPSNNTDTFVGSFTVVPEPSSFICLTLVSLICGIAVSYKKFIKRFQ